MIVRCSFVYFFVTLFGVIGTAPDNSTVRLVQLLFRHGDRTPAAFFPNDPYKDYWLKRGVGVLTTKGMQEQYALGQYVRQKYSEFLGDEYKVSEIYARSTDFDRTINSAQCALAGLFPPSGDEIWNPKLLWQPIAVHTAPVMTDSLMFPSNDCPKFRKLIAEFFSSEEYKEKLASYRTFFEFLTKHAGTNVTSVEDATAIAGDLLVDIIYNFTLPSWVNSTTIVQFEEVYEYYLYYLFPTYETRRLASGPLLGQMVSNMRNKVNGTSENKMFIYAGHEVTLMLIFQALDIYNNIIPPYTATIFLELHEINDQYFVQVLYKNSTYSEPFVITLPGCQQLCPFSQFENVTKHIVIDDIYKECLLDSNSGTTVNCQTFYLSGLMMIFYLGLGWLNKF